MWTSLWKNLFQLCWGGHFTLGVFKVVVAALLPTCKCIRADFCRVSPTVYYSIYIHASCAIAVSFKWHFVCQLLSCHRSVHSVPTFTAVSVVRCLNWDIAYVLFSNPLHLPNVLQYPKHGLPLYHTIKLKPGDKLPNYTYIINTHSPTRFTHIVHVTLLTQCGNVDKDGPIQHNVHVARHVYITSFLHTA